MESHETKNVLSQFLREVKTGQENILDVAREVVGDKEQVTVAVQNRVLQPEQPPKPERAESPPRGHVFHTAQAAAEYLAAGYGSEHTVILADAAKREIGLCLNEDAAVGVETCYIRPVVHPVFAPWARLMDEGVIELRRAVLFMQTHRREIVSPKGCELALSLAQVKASTHIEAHFGTPGRGRDAINGVLIKTRVQGQEQTEPVDLPDSITIECPLFVGSESRKLEIDLTLAADGMDKVVVGFTSTHVTAAVMAEFEAMLATLQAKLPDGGVAVLGQLQYGQWQYLGDDEGKDGDA